MAITFALLAAVLFVLILLGMNSMRGLGIKRPNLNLPIRNTEGLSLRPREKSSLNLNLRPTNNPSCPLCKELIDSGVYYCNDCISLYHVDCFEEMTDGTCPTTGCKNKYMSAPGNLQQVRDRLIN
jgi:hypothetical protein